MKCCARGTACGERDIDRMRGIDLHGGLRDDEWGRLPSGRRDSSDAGREAGDDHKAAVFGVITARGQGEQFSAVSRCHAGIIQDRVLAPLHRRRKRFLRAQTAALLIP